MKRLTFRKAWEEGQETGDHASLPKKGDKAQDEIPQSRLGLLPYGQMRFAGGWRVETWILKVDHVRCSPDSSPTLPNGTEIELVLFARDHHVKSVAILVGGTTWWSSWES